MSARILIVDDDAAYARALARILVHAGHEVVSASNAEQARGHFTALEPEVVILDYQLPDIDGLSLLDELRSSGSQAVFLLNTAYPDLDVAVQAMRRGAFDYVAKDAEQRECVIRIERAVEVARLRTRAVQADTGADGALLLGDSPAMKALLRRVEALAASDDTTAFIVGETGTGKGLLARRIHQRSGRAFEPFVAVDCTTIPATLVESELFGHERGAFSGATHSKMGRVEAAANGTLFLDEIGELELPMQAKLLRLLEEREFTRVGATKNRHLTARVIAATNRDLERAVSEGRFRADLRYRLEVFVLEVPPLRSRGEDIILLASHYAAERARALGREPPELDRATRRALLAYPFPGNVRELRNMVEQAVLLSGGGALTLDVFPVLTKMQDGWEPPRTVAPPMLVSPGLGLGLVGPTSDPPPVSSPPAPLRAAAPAPAGEQTLADIRRAHAEEEKQRILAALRTHAGNITAAARDLGLSRFQLQRRITKHGL
ncbi:MAG: sigma-54-dependent transcriptional regulator [Sandaracinaceae bacterium]